MTRSDEATRRRVLYSTAGGLALGLAGCLGAPISTSDATADRSVSHEHAEGDHHQGTQRHPETERHVEGEPHDGGGDDHRHSPTEHESGHGHDHTAAVAAPADAVEFRMTTTDAGEHFEPHVLRLNPGGTATWVNESGAHSATAYNPDNDKPLLMPEGAASFDSGILAEAGAEYSHTFETEGVYHFYCAPHETLGMLGSVIVGEPDPHGQPALESVPSSLPRTAREKLEHLNEKCNEALGHSH